MREVVVLIVGNARHATLFPVAFRSIEKHLSRTSRRIRSLVHQRCRLWGSTVRCPNSAACFFSNAFPLGKSLCLQFRMFLKEVLVSRIVNTIVFALLPLLFVPQVREPSNLINGAGHVAHERPDEASADERVKHRRREAA